MPSRWVTVTTGPTPFVTCPVCVGFGCPVCHDTGQVKRANYERAKEPAPAAAWSDRDLFRLYRVVMHPGLWQRWRNRRARIRADRAWLAENEHPSRLDDADRNGE